MTQPDMEALVNHWLAEAEDDDAFIFTRPLPEIVLTKAQLLRLRPALLPDPPNIPPPILQPPPPEPEVPNKPLPPPPPAEVEEMGVAADSGLSIRSGPNARSTWLGKAAFNAVVKVEKRVIASGDYNWSVLKAINGVDYIGLAYVARGRVDGSEEFLVPKL